MPEQTRLPISNRMQYECVLKLSMMYDVAALGRSRFSSPTVRDFGFIGIWGGHFLGNLDNGRTHNLIVLLFRAHSSLQLLTVEIGGALVTPKSGNEALRLQQRNASPV